MRKVTISKSGVTHMNRVYGPFYSRASLCGYIQNQNDVVKNGTTDEVTCKKCKRIAVRLGIKAQEEPTHE